GPNGFRIVDVATDPLEVDLHLEPAGRLEIRAAGIEQALDTDGIRTSYVLKLERASDGGEDDVSRGFDPLRAGIHLDPRGTATQNGVTPGRYRATLERARYRIGKTVSLGPMGGYQSHEPVGDPEMVSLPSIEVRALETTEVEIQVPEGF